jgi:hypothetical protein
MQPPAALQLRLAAATLCVGKRAALAMQPLQLCPLRSLGQPLPPLCHRAARSEALLAARDAKAALAAERQQLQQRAAAVLSHQQDYEVLQLSRAAAVQEAERWASCVCVGGGCRVYAAKDPSCLQGC